MKLQKDKQIDYKSNTVLEGQDATIDMENMDKLFDLLQDPYKNPIGAVVREYTSNAFDSHSEAAFIRANSISDIRTEFPDYLNYSDDEIEELKKHLQVFNDDAVFVTLSKDETGHYWATEDFGVGLSDNRVKNIFCSYLKSTKESTNSAIGAFGIGSKSGLSYTDVIHIRTRYNGVERVYMLRKGEKSPRLDNVSSEDTTERNGTQIKIYIKSVKRHTWSSNVEPEIDKFEEECKKQLAYFDNVYFTGSHSGNLPKDYSIFQGKSWLKNTAVEPFGNLHLCLGKVAYPIDWDILGIEPIKSSVALKFEIGELDIIQTREDLKYTPRTKEALVDKITLFQDEINDKWVEQYNDGVKNNFFDYLLYKKDIRPASFKTGNETIDFSMYDVFSNKKDESYFEDKFSTKYAPFKDINFDDSKIANIVFFNDFSITSYINSSGLKHRNETVWNRIKNNDSNIYRIEGPHDVKKSKYIVTEVENDSILLLRRTKTNLNFYIKHLSLDKYPKEEWRDIIKTVQKASKSVIFERTKSYQKVEIDSEWLNSTYKKRKSLDISKFNMYLLDLQSSYSGSFDTEKIVKNRVYGRIGSKLCIYGTKEQKEYLKVFGDLFSEILNTRTHPQSKRLIVTHTGVRNFKYLEDLPNLITINNMAEHKLFIKYCTARYMSKNLFISGSHHLHLLSSKMENINYEIGKDVHTIDSFINKYNFSPSNKILLDSFYKDVLERDILDKKMIDLMYKVNDYFEELTFLSYLNLRETPDREIAFIIYRINKSLPVSRHKRMNSDFYVTLTDKELEWLEGSKDEEMYKKTRMLK